MNAGIAGTVQHTLQAVSESRNIALKSGKNTLPINMFAKAPPKLPQPATMEFAVPATSRVNMEDVQDWLVTKADPPTPERRRNMYSSVAVWAKPVIRTGIAAASNVNVVTILGPYLRDDS